ncbi:MAG TPA: TlpA disulfide reductase family protein [Flavobacteriales bacterium]
MIKTTLRSTLITAVAITGCSVPDTADPPLRPGTWRVELTLRQDSATPPVVLPFLLSFARDSAGWIAEVHNGEERIPVREISLEQDSITLRMPLFDSEFKGRILNDSTLIGQWYNFLKGPDYRIPFMAYAGAESRFPQGVPPRRELSGEWKTYFHGDSCCEKTPAIGIFQQTGGGLLGTFATETGDYRFLEGAVQGDSLFLSSFNGNQANLFRGVWRNDSLFGTYYAGNHWKEQWVASKDPAFRLRDEDSLTFLKEGYDMVDFRFPNIDGGAVSPSDARHRGKVMMVQIMGSWCPNCADEAVLLEQMQRKYHGQGLDVIAVAFERYPTEERAVAGLKRFRDHLDLTYPIAYAGEAKKGSTSAKLPFLDQVKSFPTCIFIGRDGKVRRIHTGFYGPGTGSYYQAYSRELDRYINELLHETPPGALASSAKP